MTIPQVKAIVHRSLPAAVGAGQTAAEPDACPRCSHDHQRRLRRGCAVRLQVIYDSDDVRCGCAHEFHRR